MALAVRDISRPRGWRLSAVAVATALLTACGDPAGTASPAPVDGSTQDSASPTPRSPNTTGATAATGPTSAAAPAPARPYTGPTYTVAGADSPPLAARRIGIVADADATPEEMEALGQAHGLTLVEPPEGNVYLFEHSDEEDHEALVDIARRIEEDADHLVEDSGLVTHSDLPDDSYTPTLVTDEIILHLEPGADADAVVAFLDDQQLETVYDCPLLEDEDPRIIVALSPETREHALAVAEELEEHHLVRIARPNYRIVVECNARDPNDPLFARYQWHHRNEGQGGGTPDADIDTPEAWAIWEAAGGKDDIVIAVIDLGFDVTHPDLEANLWTRRGEVHGDGDSDGDHDDDGNGFDDDVHGWDFVDHDGDLRGDPHGTAVAGCLGARGDNNLGVVGSYPRCKMMFIRIAQGSFRIMHLEEAFQYAIEHGADVITNSWTMPLDSPQTDHLKEIIEDATREGRDGKGCVILFPMTNNRFEDCGVGDHQKICSLDGVLAVGGVSNQDQKVVKSGYGACLDVLGPTRRMRGSTDEGTLNIATTDERGQGGYNPSPPSNMNCPVSDLQPPIGAADHYTCCFGGTSAATPIVAGVAGLVLAVDDSLTSLEVRRLLRDTCDKVEPLSGDYSPFSGLSGWPDGSNTHGYGRVNAYEAVRVVAPREPATPGGPAGRGGYDLFLRDNGLDWGNTEQPSSVAFDPDTRSVLEHWTSPDVKIDAPGYADPPPTTSRDFDALADEPPQPGAVNRVYVRVRNRGPRTIPEVHVRALATGAGTSLPPLPDRVLTNFPAMAPLPASGWTPLDAAPRFAADRPGVARIERLEYSGASTVGSADDRAQIVWFDLELPPAGFGSEASLQTLLVIAHSEDDPVSTETSLVEQLAPTDNNVTLRNLHRAGPHPGNSSSRLVVRNPESADNVVHLQFSAPAGWNVRVEPDELHRGVTLRPGAEVPATVHVTAPAGETGAVTVWQLRGRPDVPASAERVMGGATFTFGG